MSSLDKLPNSFHAAGTNGRHDLSLPRCTSCCSTNCPCSIWSGSWIALFAKDNVAPNRRSSVGWISARTGKSSVVVGRKYPVRMRKASVRMSMKRVCVLRHQNVAQYSDVEYTKETANMRNVLYQHPVRIPQIASTARLGWRVFCAKPQDGDGE